MTTVPWLAVWQQRTKPPTESSHKPPHSHQLQFLGQPGASPAWMPPGPGTGADGILSSAGEVRLPSGTGLPALHCAPGHGQGRDADKSPAQKEGSRSCSGAGATAWCSYSCPHWWHLNTADFKSIFSSPEPKPHPQGPVGETEGTLVWQRGSGQGRSSLSLTPSLSTLGTKPPQMPHWDFAHAGAIPLQRQALGQPQPPLITQSLTLSCTAKPHQALCGQRLIGKAPFPITSVFPFTLQTGQ